MIVVWATRGRTWGFRLVATGGLDDPLAVYEETFSGAGDEPEVWQRVGTHGALRFPDPLGRRDRSGRVVPHDFVVLPPDATAIGSVAEGRDRFWPEVAATYAEIYAATTPPSAEG